MDKKTLMPYFGEGVLTSRNMTRKASAVTRTWCTLYRLDKASIQRVAAKSPAMNQLYKKMRARTLLRAARMILFVRKIRWTKSAKLFVRLDRAVNLPRTDSMLGFCDPYATLRIGYPEPERRTFTSMVQYGKLNPKWDETFIFQVDFTGNALKSGTKAFVY